MFADHWLRSDVVEAGVLLACEPFVRTVEAEEFEDVEVTDPEEFVRERGLRGANIPLASSGFIELLPSIEPHAGRDSWGKAGGLATAVMRLVEAVSMMGSRVWPLGTARNVFQPSSIHTVSTVIHPARESDGRKSVASWCQPRPPISLSGSSRLELKSGVCSVGKCVSVMSWPDGCEASRSIGGRPQRRGGNATGPYL